MILLFQFKSKTNTPVALEKASRFTSRILLCLFSTRRGDDDKSNSPIPAGVLHRSRTVPTSLH